jgi:hypothetical protein
MLLEIVKGGLYRKGKWTSWANFVKVKELKKGLIQQVLTLT